MENLIVKQKLPDEKNRVFPRPVPCSPNTHPWIPMQLLDLIGSLKQRQDLSVHHMQEAITAMMEGTVAQETMASFLLALREKGESVDELVGAAQAMRSKMTPIRSPHSHLVDTCGTGGDGSGTFNISTAAGLVAAAAGIPVAKHGNRAISSRSGSADALRELGVNVDASQPVVEKCLKEIGICFCFAPLFHGSVKNVAAVRKQLGVPTIFNMLGPLCNPAGADFQMIGVGKPWQRPLIAEALQKLGTRKSIVVHGTDGLCEISNAAPTEVSIVEPDSIRETTWSPEDFGLRPSTRQEILADGPVQSAARIREAFSGQPGGARDIVVLNAAAAIWLTDSSASLMESTEIALKQIESGQALRMLEKLVAQTHFEPFSP